MKVILLKLIKDFRLAKGKLFLLILASALSGWGISVVIYSYFLTERDFEENFAKTYPADMTLVIDNYSEGLDAKLLEDPQVVDVERREAITARIKNSQDSWIPVIIYAIDDVNEVRYDRINILDEENKTRSKYLIEKNAFFFLSENHESVDLIFKEEEDIVTWQLDGKVHDARQAPARMEGIVYSYLTSIDPIEPYLVEGRRRLLIKTNVSSDKEKLITVKERLEKIIKENGSTLLSANIPEPGQHIHQGIVDGIAFLQQSGGAVLSVMGIILLSLILLTWIFPQVSDIGVMKAIGASTSHLFKSYVVVLIGIIAIGLIIGLPLGYISATMYNRGVAFFQNFEVVERLLPVPIHLFVLVVCIVIPLVFGIFPLLKSSRTTVNDALNKTFYIPHRGFFKLSQRLISSTKLKYGLNNLFRQSQRTALTMLLLAVGLALYFTAANVDHSIRSDLKIYAETSPYEVVIALPTKMKKSDVAFINELSIVEEALGMTLERLTFVPPNRGNPEFSVIRTMSSDFEIDDSFMLRGTLDKSCSNCVYVNGEEMRKSYADAALGTTVEITTIEGETRTLVFSGVLKDLVVIGAPFLTFDDRVADDFSGLAFKMKDNISQQELISASNTIDDLFIENGINVLAMSSVSRRMGGIIGHLDPTFLVIKATGIFTIVLGLFGLLIVLNLTIQERTREIGIMKSIGSPFRKISGMFKQEFILISLLALIVGSLLAVPIATALIDIIASTIIRHPVPFKNDFKTLLLVLVIIVVVQTLLITVYNRFKIGKNARELLDHNF